MRVVYLDKNCCKQLLTSICGFLDIKRHLSVEIPKIRAGSMIHNSVQRPSRKSCSAFCASASSRPAATSFSICLSQASASNSANQARNAASLGVKAD
ncbi:MAG: hypothetical protein ACHBN1_15055 [Heteroscytonema crispum UTEX LB 1556]